MESTKFLRHTAIKTLIHTLLSGNFVQEDEQNQNYFLTEQKEKLYRINVIGIIVHKETVGSITNLLIDDGSGSIPVRFFEENDILKFVDVSDVVFIIGKVRMYNEENYISSEICVKSNPLWLKVRKKELKISHGEQQQENISIQKPITKIKNEYEENELSEDNEFECDNKIEMLPFQKMMILIKELDSGEGVLIEDIIEKSSLENSGDIIIKMLEKGDIFQNVPGKVKVL